jgi:hypothetical protein
MQNVPGCVHLALDGWAAPNGGSFLGIVALFLSTDEVQNVQDAVNAQKVPRNRVERAPITSLILDFVKLEKAHTGEYLAEQVYKVLKDFGIELKVRYIVLYARFSTDALYKVVAASTDNASNNDTLFKHLDLLLPAGAQLSAHTRTRCFAHVLNLVVGVCMLHCRASWAYHSSRQSSASSHPHGKQTLQLKTMKWTPALSTSMLLILMTRGRMRKAIRRLVSCRCKHGAYGTSLYKN